MSDFDGAPPVEEDQDFAVAMFVHPVCDAQEIPEQHRPEDRQHGGKVPGEDRVIADAVHGGEIDHGREDTPGAGEGGQGFGRKFTSR